MAIGAISTTLVLMLSAWSWKVGVVFLATYMIVNSMILLRPLAMILYLSAWGYSWWEYFVAGYEAVKHAPDKIVLVLGLVPGILLGFLFLKMMLAGLPNIGRTFPKRAARPPKRNEKPEKESVLVEETSQEFDPYTVLDISPDASNTEIESGYRKQMALYHPDKVAHLGTDFQKMAHERTLEIQRAFKMLVPEGKKQAAA